MSPLGAKGACALRDQNPAPCCGSAGADSCCAPLARCNHLHHLCPHALCAASCCDHLRCVTCCCTCRCSFRTQICSAGAYCQRRICWFAHAAEELRYPGSLSDQAPAQQQAMAAAAVAEIGRKGCAPAAAAAAAVAAGVGTRCTPFTVPAFGQCPDEAGAQAGATGRVWGLGLGVQPDCSR